MFGIAEQMKHAASKDVPLGSSRNTVEEFVRINFSDSKWENERTLVCTCNSVTVFPVARNWLEVRFSFEGDKLVGIEVLNKNHSWVTA